MTPLYLAASEGFVDVVKYLIDQGASPYVKKKGVSAFHISVLRNDTNLVQCLVESLVAVNDPIPDQPDGNQIPLMHALNNSMEMFVTILRSPFCDLSHFDHWKVLHYAVKSNNIEHIIIIR